MTDKTTRCGVCNGTGLDPLAGTWPCCICFGDGVVRGSAAGSEHDLAVVLPFRRRSRTSGGGP